MLFIGKPRGRSIMISNIYVYVYIYIYACMCIYSYEYIDLDQFRTISRTHISTWVRVIILHHQRGIPQNTNGTTWEPHYNHTSCFGHWA